MVEHCKGQTIMQFCLLLPVETAEHEWGLKIFDYSKQNFQE
jgi:hypothetical protein